MVEPETWDRVLYNDRSLVILIFILDRFNFIDPFILVLKTISIKLSENINKLNNSATIT